MSEGEKRIHDNTCANWIKEFRGESKDKNDRMAEIPLNQNSVIAGGGI